MSVVTSADRTTALRETANDRREALAELPAKSLWRSEAPDAVRKAWRAGDGEAAWSAWRRWLTERSADDPFSAVSDRKTPAINWGASEDVALRREWPTADVAAAAVEEWIEASLDGPLSVRHALECVALADAMPRLADKLDADLWWRLGEALLAIATDAAAAAFNDQTNAEEIVAQQLLAGELPYALAAALPEIKPLHRLRSDGAAALTDGLDRWCDGEGLPHADVLQRLPMLAACWTRCRLRAQALGKRPWSADAETQYEWLVRQLLRLVDRDGRVALAGEPTIAAPTLLRAMLNEVGDDEDLAAAGLRLKGFKADAGDPPEPSNHSEWAGVTVLASGWGDKAPRLTATHAGRSMRLELRSGRRTLLRGDWPIAAERDGEAVVPADDWDVSCWFSDEDCDYLELSLDLVGGGTLERLLFLAREDGVAMLGELLLTGDDEPRQLAVQTTLPLVEGVSLSPEAETHEAAILADGKPAGGVFPLALPEWRSEPPCGYLQQAEGRLSYRVEQTGRNLAAPLWLDLAPKRFGKQHTWRRLTVAESLKRVDHDVAVGYRVQSGSDQWIAYRSLAPRANRTLLGHNLSSEALVGRFLKTGEVDEYFEIDED